MKRAYGDWTPRADTLALVHQAEDICDDYARRGYDLTLRQLYYQFVARDVIPNTERSYSKLGTVVNKARMAGMLNWLHIVDRTRSLRGTQHYETPADIIDTAARSYREDKWGRQPVRVEVWVEKEALAGVVQRVANAADVDYFSCRGYVSQSEQWRAAQRLRGYLEAGQRVVVLHLGDHDPSGIDMTRDIGDRLRKFVAGDLVRGDNAVEEVLEMLDNLRVDRIALNMDQVDQYNPPPNPTKLTDSRAGAYVADYGFDSWELDALDPDVLVQLIRDKVAEQCDEVLWDAAVGEEDEQRTFLADAAERWGELTDWLAI